MKQINRQTLKYFIGHTTRYWPFVLGSFFFVGVVVLLQSIYIPMLFRDVINLIVSAGDDRAAVFPEISALLLQIFAIFILLEAVLWRIGVVLYLHWHSHVIKNITDDCFLKLQDQSFDFFTNNFAGGLVSKMRHMYGAFWRINDIFFWSIFRNLILVIFSTILLYTISPIFVWIFLAWMIIFLASTIAFSSWKIKFDVLSSEAETRTTAQLADTITNATTIKIFSHLPYEYRLFNKVTQNRRRLQFKSWGINELNAAFMGCLMSAVEIAILYFAVKLWIAGDVSVGSIVLIQSLLIGIFQQLWGLNSVLRDFYTALADAEAMTRIIFSTSEIVDPLRPQKCRIKKGNLQINNISFAYKNRPPIFENFDIKIPAGKKIGIVGESGAGKTTLVKLLLRFVDPTSGEIIIDDQRIKDIRQSDLRKKIAYVPQDPILFHRTLFDNIHYGQLDATDREVYKAARLAHADEFIMQSPDGYDTLVGERGVKLSGGERQRISIARAILKNAPILILDEATSALDSRSEKLIQDGLENLMRGRTTLVIAHRLSTLRQMDEIIVLHHGKIIERGDHKKLLRIDGKYAELWKHQAGGFLK